MAKFDDVKRGFKEMMINNFFGGFAWALGVTIGFSIIIFLLTNVFRDANWIPFIGNLISDITKYVLANLQSSPQLIK